MAGNEWLATRFEETRPHLRGVAYRMLGSASEADDAVQEAWLRFSQSDTSAVANLTGWLTTVVARVCLDVLRSRTSRREEPLEAQQEPIVSREDGVGPEQEALLAESVGLALLVVLQTLAPAERVSFVLHDLFGVSFDEIAPIVGRSSAAARQLASRARRQVHGKAAVSDADLAGQRSVVDTFLTALRAGDIEALVAVLDPDLVVNVDMGAGAVREVRGARTWAKGAVAFAQRVRGVRAALVDGAVGLILAPHGRLARALRLTVAGGRISRIEIIAHPVRLQELQIAVLE